MLNGPAGALIIEIELADGIYAVAEELDANRIAHQGRKDVHDSAANRKLAGGADRLLSQVTRAREMFGEEFLR